MSGIWKTYAELRESCINKRVVLWGRSEDWTAKTLAKIQDIQIEYIIDRSGTYKGTTFLGYDVFTPDKLDEEDANSLFIIITASAYTSINTSLKDLEFKPGLHYCCTPEYKDWAIMHEIKEYDRNLLISCSDNTTEEGGKRFSKMGGGLYLFNTKDHSLKNKLRGHFRQIVQIDELYYVVEYVEKLLYIIDKEFNVIQKVELDQDIEKKQKPHYCGLAYHEESNLLFVTNSGTDTISVYEKESLKLINTIFISDKTKRVGGGLHHINDLSVVDDSLFVSCFSVTGSWKKDILDGGILEFDINNLDNDPNILMNNLWKPHSVEFLDNKISYLDSMRGKFWVGNQKVAGKFSGFIRGLTFDGKYYFIGQSEDMYSSELFGVKDSIMVNAGVYLFDIKTKVTRFYSFPDLSNIHDIKIF